MAKHALQYIFFYDPVQTEWTQGYQFEASFAKYLTTLGLEAEIVPTEGNVGARILLIKKKQEIAMLNIPSGSTQMPQTPKPKPIKQQLESLRLPAMGEERKRIEKGEKFKKGRFLKTKDYLKK